MKKSGTFWDFVISVRVAPHFQKKVWTSLKVEIHLNIFSRLSLNWDILYNYDVLYMYYKSLNHGGGTMGFGAGDLGLIPSCPPIQYILYMG